MYVAVKLRQGNRGRSTMGVRLYTEDTARAKFLEYQRLVEESRDGVAAVEVKQVEPPSMTTTELVMEVVHVTSPTSFWIQHGEKAAEKAERLQEILATSVTSLARVADAGTVARGQLYIAPFTDEGDEEPCFYRARVDTIADTTATVFFIDYGNVAKVEVSELLVIGARLVAEHPSILSTPGLALEVSLAKLRPSRLRSSRGLWDQRAVARFRELVEGEGGRLVGTIYSVTSRRSEHSKFVVSLASLTRECHGGEEMEVRATMLAEHLAEAAMESYTSKENHKERMNYLAYNLAMQKHLDDFSRHEKAPQVKPAGEETKMVVQMNLTGPFSPLEHRLRCLHRHGGAKTAAIETDSVNAVLLEQLPGDASDHYLVAAHVGTNPAGDTLRLRSTTWLPARLGLGAFATMLFAPQVELRVDKRRRRLTGCITGLGPRGAGSKADLATTEALFPEHDIETRFDTNVTNQDIASINAVRYWMNQCLSKTDAGLMRLTQVVSLDRAQREMAGELEELLLRERRLEEKEGVEGEYRWNLLEEAVRLPAQVNQQPQDIFKVSPTGAAMVPHGFSYRVFFFTGPPQKN